MKSVGVLGCFQQVELVPAACLDGSELEVAGGMQHSYMGMDENSVVLCQVLPRSLCANVLLSQKCGVSFGFKQFNKCQQEKC